MRFLRPARALGAAVVLLLGACDAAQDVAAPPQVEAARIVMPPTGAAMAAGYFELRNPGRQTLELVAVTSPGFESIEMHETIDDDGVSRMRRLDTVAVAPGASLRFAPGGKHLMLMGPKPLTRGASLPLRLSLRAADGTMRRLDVPFAVESVGGPAPGALAH